MNEPFASFAVDGTTMLWQDEPLTGQAIQTSSFRLIDVNRNSTGRFAGQPAQGPKPLKAFVISNQVGSDGATERRYPFTLEVVTPKTIIGGCARLPYRWSVRFVTGVEANDTLNVRSVPSTTGKVLTVVPPSGYIWTTGRVSKSWVSVAVVTFPGGDRGPAQIVEGWANAKFMAAR
jgi:uncharacterized membrane protein